MAKFDYGIRSYDIHVYFAKEDLGLAKDVQAEIRASFPQLKVYKFWENPIGPHPIGNFEVNLVTKQDFASLVSWIQLNRKDFSVLVHPNTGNPLKDHTVHAMWIGERQPLKLEVLKEEDDGYGYF